MREIDTLMTNEKNTKIIDDQGTKPICIHPLDFTVTITLNVNVE